MLALVLNSRKQIILFNMPNSPKKRNRPWVVKRPKQHRSIDMTWFYNDSRWRKFSKAFKQRHPLCIDCDKKGIVTQTEVTDHKIRYVEGGPGFDLNNLKDKDFEPRCAKCHNSRSGRQSHGK